VVQDTVEEIQRGERMRRRWRGMKEGGEELEKMGNKEGTRRQGGEVEEEGD